MSAIEDKKATAVRDIAQLLDRAASHCEAKLEQRLAPEEAKIMSEAKRYRKCPQCGGASKGAIVKGKWSPIHCAQKHAWYPGANECVPWKRLCGSKRQYLGEDTYQLLALKRAKLKIDSLREEIQLLEQVVAGQTPPELAESDKDDDDE